MSHTPGPWVRFDYRVFTMKNNGEHIDKAIAWTASNAQNRTPEAMANAQLISAAPDLLAALRRAANVMEMTEALPTGALDVVRAVRAAIAKAEGGDRDDA